MSQQVDVTAIGNAIVDVISREDDSFLDRHGLTKASMTLIDDERALALYDELGARVLTAGGSAANTVAGIASFGGEAGFIGKVGADELGAHYRADMAALGVHFDTPAATTGEPTGRSMIVVTPDAQRTMSTNLGAATTLYPDDIDTGLVKASSVLYCEGYIWDVPVTKSAIRVAIKAAKEAGTKVSFTLSDSFCVHRHHGEWLELLDGSIDILFGNEEEMKALSGAESFEAVIDWLQGRCEIACVTRSELGSAILVGDDVHMIEPVPVENVIDTTGAGDQYSAGVLFGLSINADPATAGRLGSLAASEVLGHLGPRPATPLRQVAIDAGFVLNPV